MFEGAICKIYEDDKLNSMILGKSVSFIIIGVNVILKLVTIKLAEWVGHDTHSAQRSFITNMVFMAQFFNTGILILIVSANLREHEPFEFTRNFDGQYTDYVPDWYVDVGLTIL